MDAAAAIRERLFDAGNVTPDGIADVDTAILRGDGLSSQQTDYHRVSAP